MTHQIDPERLRLLKSRLDFSQGDVVLPSAFVRGLLRELEEAADAQRRWEQYRASVNAFLGRGTIDDAEVGP